MRTVSRLLIGFFLLGCGADETPGMMPPPPPPTGTFDECLAAGGVLHQNAAFDNRHGSILRMVAGSTGQVALSSEDGSIKTWSLQSGEEGVLDPGVPAVYDAAFGEGNPIANGLAYAPDGSWVLAGDDAGAITRWDTHAGELINTLPAAETHVTAVAVSADGARCAVSGDEFGGNVLVGPISWGGFGPSLTTQLWFVHALAFLPSGALLTAGDIYGQPAIEIRDPFDPNTVAGTWAPPLESGGVVDLALSSDGLVAAVGNQFVLLLDPAAPSEPVFFTVVPNQRFVGVAFTPGEGHVAALQDDGQVVVFDLTGAEVGRSPVADAIAVRQDATTGQLVTAGTDGQIRLFSCTN